MVWTQADIDKLKIAIASGLQEVTFDGPPKRTVKYQNLTEMRNLLAEMVSEVNSASGTYNYSFAQTNKGFYNGCG